MTMHSKLPGMRSDTVAVHAGRDDLTALGVHALPIDLSTTSPLPSVAAGGDAYEHMGSGAPIDPGETAVYARLWNTTVARFEHAVAELEGAPEAVAFATGMAATTAVLIDAVGNGKPHVVAIRPLYGGTDHLLESGLLGTQVSFVAPDGVRTALRQDTGLVALESPGNPTLDLIDIAAVVEQAEGVPVMVDNTFATPILQRPLEHGARIAVHSATKYLGGHGDSLGGVIATDVETAAALRRVRMITGSILHPWAAYLLHRGLPTLPIRVRTQQAHATQIAQWLAVHPQVTRVFHPSLPQCDPAGLIGRQMAGPGSIVSFELKGGYPQAAAVADAVRLITHAVSLGGVDTLIQHPAALTHRPVVEQAKPSSGLLRLSVGLEDPSDIIADLDAAIGVR